MEYIPSRYLLKITGSAGFLNNDPDHGFQLMFICQLILDSVGVIYLNMKHEKTYTLDELSSLTAVPKRTIRFYVQSGLVPKPEGANRGAFNGFQLTGVWGDTFANGLCTFSGFVDVWYDKDVCGKLIVLSEPQFWFNLNKLKGMDDVNVSLGTEVEISNNFVFDSDGNSHKFYAIPTIAAKWTF